jgi:hypothetical protein
MEPTWSTWSQRNSAKGLQGIMPTWVSGGGGNGHGGRERGWSGAGRRASLLAWSLPPSRSSLAPSTMSPTTTPTPATSSWSTQPRLWSPGRRYLPPRGHPTGGITNSPPCRRRAGLGRRHPRRPGRSARCRSPFRCAGERHERARRAAGYRPHTRGDRRRPPPGLCSRRRPASAASKPARSSPASTARRVQAGRARPRPRAARRRPRAVRWRPRALRHRELE